MPSDEPTHIPVSSCVEPSPPAIHPEQEPAQMKISHQKCLGPSPPSLRLISQAITFSDLGQLLWVHLFHNKIIWHRDMHRLPCEGGSRFHCNTRVLPFGDEGSPPCRIWSLWGLEPLQCTPSCHLLSAVFLSRENMAYPAEYGQGHSNADGTFPEPRNPGLCVFDQ